MAGGFEVDLDVLNGAAAGVAQTVDDMQTCKVEDICGPAEEYGHDGLREAFKHFCDRWQEGVEILLDDGEAISTSLKAAALAYRTSDHQAKDVFERSGPDPAMGAVDG